MEWVVPVSQNDHVERIIGRVVATSSPPGYVLVSWLSSKRGLWKNEEAWTDLMIVGPPSRGLIETIFDTAEPTLPYGYEA